MATAMGDNGDAFPNDPSETVDTDGDGIGNNADPNDDGDWVPDEYDAFPLDPSEWWDADGDGVGDNSDAFPSDPTETTDSDGDGVGDNSDAFPLDPSEWVDSDSDGLGDNADTVNNAVDVPSSSRSGRALIALMVLASALSRLRPRSRRAARRALR